MTRRPIPAAVLSVCAEISANRETHATLDSLYTCVFHGNWTLSPRQTGQSERSDAGVVFYS